MKNISLNVAVAIASIIITLILVEIGLHIIDIPKYSTYAGSFRRADQTYHHALIPNTTAKVRTEEFDVIERVNNVGLRNRDINLTKAKYRILMLGDSFTEGSGVNAEDTISQQLENILIEKGYDIEVLNAGIASYSPILEYLYLKKDGIKLNPDIIILNLDISDLRDDYNYEKISIKDDEGEIIAVPESQTTEIWTGPEYCSKISSNLCVLAWRFLWNIDDAIKRSHKNYANEGDITTDRYFITRFNLTKEKTEPHYSRTFTYVKKIQDFLKGRNINFILVTYPYGHQVNENEWKDGRKRYNLDEYPVYSQEFFDEVWNFSESNGIYFINTYYKFEGSNEFPLFYKSDIHMTKAGYKLVAEGIFEQMFLNDEVKNSVLQTAG
ncbi:MAG TPA: SGNH/GDSL hydrolase family protein [archaeon]|nr:SGNH/GDSL hydrolase family protein [archaeon]